MIADDSRRIWHVTPGVLATPALAVALLLGGVAGLELAARSELARSALRPPSLGGSLAIVDPQLARLRAFERATGPVDCIFLGSSMLAAGVDPEVFARTLGGRIGQPLRCFNFGIQALTANDAAVLAQLLIDESRPRLLIYAPGTRDLTPVATGPDLRSAPWARYRRGEFSLDGWLTEHSRAYRYVLAYRPAVGPDMAAAAAAIPTRSDGFRPQDGEVTAAQLTMAERLLREQFGDYGVSDQQLDSLNALLDLHGRQTQVAMLRMPIHPLMVDALRQTHDYERGRALIAGAAAAHGVPLWDATSNVAAEPDLADPAHLNRRGADTLSRWLAERAADAAAAGQLAISQDRPDAAAGSR